MTCTHYSDPRGRLADLHLPRLVRGLLGGGGGGHGGRLRLGGGGGGPGQVLGGPGEVCVHGGEARLQLPLLVRHPGTCASDSHT